jgi:hypothetical protein
MLIERSERKPNAKLARPRACLDRRVTVERLHDLGVRDNEETPYLLKLKSVFDEQVKIATEDIEKLPFAISHRILQVFICACKMLGFRCQSP